MSRKDSILVDLVKAPWWVSVLLSGFVYIALRFIAPAIAGQNNFLKSMAIAGQTLAPLIAFIFLLPAPVSFFISYRKKKLPDKQKDIDSIRSLSWKQFEELVAEAYRRKGYSVVENDGAGPDGGVDLVLKKDGNLFLVQCKQWKSYKVGVPVIREMYGVMTAKHAQGVIIITSGMFTQEAKHFAEDKPIDLVEGNQLAVLIGSVQLKPSFEMTLNSMPTALDRCPACGSELTLRTARKGKNPGQQFWGCSRFPECKFTKAYE